MYARAGSDPDGFWRDEANRIDWIKPFTKVKNVSWDPDNLLHQMVRGRHAECRQPIASTAICPSMPTASRSSGKATIRKTRASITYAELHDEVCRFANVLKAQGVKKGDRVTIYLPMIPEAAYAMLACARIGAVHSVVFAGFSPDSLADRILDCASHHRHHRR